MDELFCIEGFVAGRPVSARWVNGSLDASAELLKRSAALATVDRDPMGHGMTLSQTVADTPRLIFASLIRAFDMVTTIDIAPHR